MAKKKIKKNIKRLLSSALSDNKLSIKELRKISKKATKKGFSGNNKKLAKIINKQAAKISPEARKVGVRKNTQRLKQIKKSVTATQPQTPFYGPLKDPTKPAPNTNLAPFPAPTDPGAIPISTEVPQVREQEAPKPVVLTPEPHTPPPLEAPPEPTVGKEVEVDTPPPPTPKLETIDYKALLDELVAQRNQPQQAAPTINVQMPEMPEPDEALGRAKATSTYLSGGSAGGIRRRRSNRSKLGLSGLGTNQLNRNVSNLLSIRGISI